jgi:hypothetical protein
MIGRLTRNSSESGIDSSSCKPVAALHASASNIRTLRIFVFFLSEEANKKKKKKNKNKK